MEDHNTALILGAIDECIENFIEERKQRVGPFIERHFSIRETLDLQKKSWHLDLILNPLNALWALPYLSVKKGIETLDKMGWVAFTPILEKIPSGFKTRYQKEIERKITLELLDYDILIKELEKHPALAKLIETKRLTWNPSKLKGEIQKEIEKYSSSQAFIADLCGSLVMVATGWYFFGDKTLGMMGLGSRIARKLAHDKAASGFFLGEKMGSAFYNVFPPTPTKTQLFMATLVVGVLLTAFSLFASAMSDPLRKRLGLHQRKLLLLIEGLEEKLFAQLKKDIKSSLKNPVPEQMNQIASTSPQK